MSTVITPNQTPLGLDASLNLQGGCSTEQTVLHTAVRGDQVNCGDNEADDDNESVDSDDNGDGNDNYVDNGGDDGGDDTMRTTMIQVQIDPLRLLWGHSASGGGRGSLPPHHPG